MNRKIDETKLTAYVLGELEADEAMEIERLLKESEELRAEVDAIRDTVAVLEEGFLTEPTPALSDDQRASIVHPAKSGWKLGTAYKIAAVVILAVAVGVVYHNIPREDLAIGVTPEPARIPAIQTPAQLANPSEPAETSTGDEATPPTGVAPQPVAGASQAREAGTQAPPIKASSQPLSGHPDVRTQTTSAPTKPAKETGRIWGTVRDESGGVVPGIEVDLRNLASSEKERAVTNDSGQFAFDELAAPGRYSLSAAQAGFQTSRIPKIDVRKNEDVEVGVQLKLGQLAEAESVTGGGSTLVESRPTAMREKRQSATGEASRFAMVATSVSKAADALSYTDHPDAIYPPTEFNTEAYDRIDENEFIRVADRPLSTFSIDVDTASYSNIRRFLMDRQMPPPDAVRIEELVNYFRYDYAGPRDGRPFAAHMEAAAAPWNPDHLLLRIGLKGREIDLSHRKPGNFVFLIDVSGSMQPANKLPLLTRALRLMVERLNEEDRIAIVVYAGASGLVLPSTPCSQKQRILDALDGLQAGGSTNGGAGIALAYKVARQNLIPDGINRVVLATDGDFNVGVTNQGELTRMLETNAKSGVFLTVLGFGMGNYKDSTLEKLADRGNGNYAYIDTLREARKVLVEQMGGTLVTIAKDVKIQVEFNPREIAAYRLIGYENRLLRDQDFNDDTKDAGEIGAGHTVTVLYELVPPGAEANLPPAVDPLKYQKRTRPASEAGSGELLTLKLRYKEPREETSRLMEIPLKASEKHFDKASTDFRFAASVAGFGMLLRDSRFKGDLSWDEVLEMARKSRGEDSEGYRSEFLDLIRRARALSDLDAIEER